ncbi:MAG: thioredoxin family protein [Oligoflexia bacterium]|nr:thioredoxin family protein [Oligoflexia bacterium]
MLELLESALEAGQFSAYFFVFIGGILASFTPCIFPMIPITISVIGIESLENKKTKSFLLSIAYVHGVAFTYSILGILAARTGAFFGSFLGNIWIVGVISFIFLAMGLSMLGFYEIQTPKFIRNNFGVGGKNEKGLFGAFVAGIVSGVVASPCIGPILVSILTFVAQSADMFKGFTLLFTFAMGLGMIFIILGTFSGLLTHLPRSGAWMVRIKQVFGVILIGMSVYYLKPFLPWFHSEKAMQLNMANSVQWQLYSEELIQMAALDKKPVMIDFWAQWCAACHELDKKTYTNGEVISQSESFVRLKFDATHSTPEVERVFEKYQVVGLPTVIFINRDGKVVKEATITGFVKPEQFIFNLKKTL